VNALVKVEFTLDLPEDLVAKIIGRADDGTDSYYQHAAKKVESAVLDDIMGYLEYAGEPVVEFIT
jgi:hypothetical protein